MALNIRYDPPFGMWEWFCRNGGDPYKANYDAVFGEPEEVNRGATGSGVGHSGAVVAVEDLRRAANDSSENGLVPQGSGVGEGTTDKK